MTSHPNISERDLELLSAYLDGELSDDDRRALEQRLAAESDLHRALDELRATVRLVGSLPRLTAPHSFALDPAEYARREPWWRRLFAAGTVLQLSGALGTAASVVLIVLGLALSPEDSVPLQDAPAPSATSGAAPAAAILPTAAPDTPTLAPSPLAPMERQMEDGADEDMAADSAEEAIRGLEQAPMAAPASPLGESGAASTLSDAEGFAPPSGPSPLPSELEAPQMESFAAGEIAADTAEETEALRSAEDDGAIQVSTATAFPPPTATIDAAVAETEEAAVSPTEALKGTPSAEQPAIEQARDSGPRWWLVGIGAAGLLLSAMLFVFGRRQAGA